MKQNNNLIIYFTLITLIITIWLIGMILAKQTAVNQKVDTRLQNLEQHSIELPSKTSDSHSPTDVCGLDVVICPNEQYSFKLQ